jgi:hypothetical protein
MSVAIAPGSTREINAITQQFQTKCVRPPAHGELRRIAGSESQPFRKTTSQPTETHAARIVR